MVISHKLLALGAALLLGSTDVIQRVDIAEPVQPGVQRFETLWLITHINDAGLETIVQARLSSGEIVPLIATDRERLSSIVEAGRAISRDRKIKLRLIKFTERSTIGEITP
jgi:hypothetical protein